MNRDPQSIVLAGETDFEGFRREARRLLAHEVTPESVMWLTATAVNASLFGAAEEAAPPYIQSEVQNKATARVPSAFIQLCETLCLHDDPQRFALMYRLLWRITQEPALRHDPLDADRVQAAQMVQAVRREMHKMKAFVRFRQVPADDGREMLHVAWFEPAHYIVEAVAPFFARRFTNMRWSILTPRGSLNWSDGVLTAGPPARREDAPPADAGEALWLTYYQSIFNPARLKLAMMRKEMPRRYWPNLPEAVLISPLAAQAATRTGAMVEEAQTPPRAGLRTLPQRRTIPLVAVSSLQELRDAAHNCRDCGIGQHATQAVCGEGPERPALMFVGEQPGNEEDLQGRPFIGPAGQLFDKALKEIGLDRKTVYVANAVKHFKFELRGKRRIHKTAAQQEVLACQHWMEREIELVRPGALVALGATAARSLMGRPVAVTRERGQWLTREKDGMQVFIALHPSALLRMDAAQQQAAWLQWVDDLKAASRGPSHSTTSALSPA